MCKVWSICLRAPISFARIRVFLRAHPPKADFITLHYAYFIITCLVFSVIFWGSATPARSVSYTDSLFLTVSAMTLAGLNTINLSTINTFQQVMLFLLIMLGSAILVSSAVVHVRRKAFERKFTAVIEEERQRRKAQKASTQERGFPFALSRRRSVANSESEVDKAIHRGMVAHARKLSLDLENGGTIKSQDRPSLDEQDNLPSNLRKHDVHHIQASNDSSGLTSNGHSDFPGGRQVNSRISFSSPLSPLRTRHHTQVFSRHGGEIRREIFNPPQESMARMRLNTMKEKGKVGQDATSNFESGGLIGRNSQFHNLTLNERERLGGVEYRAIKLLERIVPLYFLLWQLLGSLGLGAYVAKNRPDTALENGLNPWYEVLFILLNI